MVGAAAAATVVLLLALLGRGVISQPVEVDFHLSVNVNITDGVIYGLDVGIYNFHKAVVTNSSSPTALSSLQDASSIWSSADVHIGSILVHRDVTPDSTPAQVIHVAYDARWKDYTNEGTQSFHVDDTEEVRKQFGQCKNFTEGCAVTVSHRFETQGGETVIVGSNVRMRANSNHHDRRFRWIFGAARTLFWGTVVIYSVWVPVDCYRYGKHGRTTKQFILHSVGNFLWGFCGGSLGLVLHCFFASLLIITVAFSKYGFQLLTLTSFVGLPFGRSYANSSTANVTEESCSKSQRIAWIAFAGWILALYHLVCTGLFVLLFPIAKKHHSLFYLCLSPTGKVVEFERQFILDRQESTVEPAVQMEANYSIGDGVENWADDDD
eukprot:TRINITY_DN4420_c0_g1_i1.p1 TRINITY_DN4420_c0_g1~~TRINITY_DN4420_c0_g1_i1.p1  ORF type:complete len:387 (-),score=80.46 TRINITY_DN4420_c0_g1_i1:54-1193(-)